MNPSAKFLDYQRLQADLEADDLIAEIFKNGKEHELYRMLKPELNDLNKQDSPVYTFLTYQKKKPAWFNQEKIANGQLVFKRYALEIMALLGVMSLPYCYAASPGNKALYLSDKMRSAPGKRLFDTATFVIDALTPGSLEANGAGILQVNRVRLIHALSRYYIKKQGNWNLDWGQPINQEDLAGTNLAFSYLILYGLQISGYDLSLSEKDDFLFTWRYIGYLLNINENLLPTSLREAQYLEALIKKRNFKKTKEGEVLTNELLNYYKTQVTGWQRELITSQVRFFVGPEAATCLGLNPNPIRDRLVSSLTTFKALQNMLSLKMDSYNAMLLQHQQLKKAFTK
jgi:hypothetical protein